MKGSRKPEIMADAAYEILTSKASVTTDNFFIDDEVLLSAGMTMDDLRKKYSPEPNFPDSKLIPDYMI